MLLMGRTVKTIVRYFSWKNYQVVYLLIRYDEELSGRAVGGLELVQKTCWRTEMIRGGRGMGEDCDDRRKIGGHLI